MPNFALVEHFPRFVEGSNRFSSFPCELDEDGCIPLSHEPGIGVEVDEAAVAAHVIAVLDAAEDRMPAHTLGDQAARALFAVAAMVVDPRFAQYLTTKTVLPILALKRVMGVTALRFDVERMRCRS